jgi:hypothetical protein
MSDYTPGPWDMSASWEVGIFDCDRAMKGGYKVIASVESRKADLFLIASAPTMRGQLDRIQAVVAKVRSLDLVPADAINQIAAVLEGKP